MRAPPPGRSVRQEPKHGAARGLRGGRGRWCARAMSCERLMAAARMMSAICRFSNERSGRPRFLRYPLMASPAAREVQARWITATSSGVQRCCVSLMILPCEAAGAGRRGLA